MSLIPPVHPSFRRKLAYGLASFGLFSLLVLGVMAGNGWLPRTDAMTGKKFGWFGRELPPGATNNWNRLAAPPPPSPVQLAKEYIHAGSRLLAVEDANAGSTPTPTPTPNFEADLAPRSTGGNGALDAADLQQWQRFFAGLDPFAGNDCQRADTAPKASLGDGTFGTAADQQQVQNYIAAIDPLTAAGGPNCTGNRPAIAENSMAGADSAKNDGMALESATPVDPGLEREVRVGAASGRRGQTVTLPVLLNLRVGETAVTFTLEYDAARFSNPRVSLGPNLPLRTLLTANTMQPGKIGVVVGTEAASFVTVPVELPIVLVTFDVRSTAAIGSTAISLTSSVARQGLANREANLVPTRYTSGNVSITN